MNQKRTTEQQANPDAMDPGVPEIPLATTTPRVALQMGRFSSMWWATMLCLILAVVLVWWSLPEHGIGVTIRFPEGHGLKPGDPVLYLGIDVGTVEDVELSPTEAKVDVHLQLKASAAHLAREGTRFWIVRPQLSLTGISGLETAVGHKYISLSPGPENALPKYVFDGLIDPPPEDSARPGIEIVLRGDKKYSVSPGSTLTFRGVEVGRILSVGLSQDSRFVDVRAKVFERYQAYLSTESRFWANSGVDFDFSLSSGFKLDTESLATLAQGGVSFLTISNDGKTVSSGHVFRLFAQPEEEWLQAADSVSTRDVELRGVVTVKKTWKQKSMLGKRDKELTFNAVPVRNAEGKCQLWLPRDMLQVPEKAIADSTTYSMITAAGERVINGATQDSSDESPLAMLEIAPADRIQCVESQVDFRQPLELEDAFAVRATVKDGETTYLHFPIESHYLLDDWTLAHFDGDSRLWHGSPVLSAEDGKIIGILVIVESLAKIVRTSSFIGDP